MWVSTQEASITVSTNLAEVTPQRQGDMELMQLFIQNSWKQLELQTLNHCRMFLQVFLLSDIVSGSGNFITPEYWDWPTPEISNLDWPRTQAPPKSAWPLRKLALRSALHLGRNQWLALPLGRWHAQHQPSRWFIIRSPTLYGKPVQHSGLAQRPCPMHLAMMVPHKWDHGDPATSERIAKSHGHQTRPKTESNRLWWVQGN